MADDIVTRLREGSAPADCGCIQCTAADEIERLRAAGDALAEYLDHHPGSEIVRAAWHNTRTN